MLVRLWDINIQEHAGEQHHGGTRNADLNTAHLKKLECLSHRRQKPGRTLDMLSKGQRGTTGESKSRIPLQKLL